MCPESQAGYLIRFPGETSSRHFGESRHAALHAASRSCSPRSCPPPGPAPGSLASLQDRACESPSRSQAACALHPLTPRTPRCFDGETSKISSAGASLRDQAASSPSSRCSEAADEFRAVQVASTVGTVPHCLSSGTPTTLRPEKPSTQCKTMTRIVPISAQGGDAIIQLQ